MMLELRDTEYGVTEIWLNGNRMDDVLEYKIKGTEFDEAQLSLDMLVCFPPSEKERKQTETAISNNHIGLVGYEIREDGSDEKRQMEKHGILCISDNFHYSPNCRIHQRMMSSTPMS